MRQSGKERKAGEKNIKSSCRERNKGRRDERKGRNDVRTVRRHGEGGGGVKGTVLRDFRLQVFFMNQFPQAPEYRMLFSGALGEDYSRKKPIAINLVTLSLQYNKS